MSRTVAGEEYSPHFFGISYSYFSEAVPLDQAPSFLPQGIAMEAVYGNSDFFNFLPIRVHAGFGWFPEKPFFLISGLEIPIVEIMSEYRSRAFGVYARGDAVLSFSNQLSLKGQARLSVQFPLTMVGGPDVGWGLDTDGRQFIYFGWISGGYPEI